LPRFLPDVRRWIRHSRNLQGFLSVWPQGSSDPSSPRLVAPWISDTVQLTAEVPPRFRSADIPDPAAGADWSQIVPSRETWRIVSILYTLVTAVAVANREPELQLLDPSGLIVFRTKPRDVVPASQGVVFTAAHFGTDDHANTATLRAIPIPGNLWAPLGYTLRTVTANLQAADQYSSIRIFAEVWPGL